MSKTFTSTSFAKLAPVLRNAGLRVRTNYVTPPELALTNTESAASTRKSPPKHSSKNLVRCINGHDAHRDSVTHFAFDGVDCALTPVCSSCLPRVLVERASRASRASTSHSQPSSSAASSSNR